MLNEIQIWPRDAILHTFQGNLRELPPISMHLISATILSAWFEKFEETYAKSVKTERSGLRN
jgi:hypothetical protein